MMRRGVWIYLAVVAAVLFCSGGDASAAEILELRYASMNPAAAWIHDHSYLPFAEKVKTATNGRVTVRIHPQQTLGKAADFLNMVKTGIADMALGVQAFNPGQFPLSEIMDLPFLPVPTAEAGGLVRWELFEKFPEIKKEYTGIKLLHVASTDPYFIITTQKPIRKLEDMKGLKLRVPGGRPADALKLMGAVPVHMPMPELYMAMDKGVVDGAPVPGEPLMGQVPIERIKYATFGLNFCTVSFWIGINENTWSRISKADQEAILKICGAEGSGWFSRTCFDDSRKAAMKLIQERKIEVITLSPEERQRWVAITKPVHESYIAGLEAKGLPARKVYDQALVLLEKYTR